MSDPLAVLLTRLQQRPDYDELKALAVIGDHAQRMMDKHAEDMHRAAPYGLLLRQVEEAIPVAIGRGLREG